MTFPCSSSTSNVVWIPQTPGACPWVSRVTTLGAARALRIGKTSASPTGEMLAATLISHHMFDKIGAIFIGGLIMVIAGAVIVLVFSPKAPPKPAPTTKGEPVKQHA